MKMKVSIELDISRTLADTIERTGFSLSVDGSKYKVQVANSPVITQRKVKVVFDRVEPEVNNDSKE